MSSGTASVVRLMSLKHCFLRMVTHTHSEEHGKARTRRVRTRPRFGQCLV